MKFLTLMFLFTIFTINLFGQSKIKKFDVQENGFNVKVNYNPIVDELSQNGLLIKIIPISADELNAQFLKEAALNGKFEYSYYENSRASYFMKRRNRIEEKTDLVFLLEGVKWLFEKEQINNEEYNELTKQIILYFDEESNQGLNNIKKLTLTNPFFIGDKFLNVFRIEITNNTNSFKNFNNEIIIENNNQILKPLSDDEIILLLKNAELLNNQKVQSLIRHNLPRVLTIPPNSKFEKMFAILPIDYENDALLISFSGNETKFRWDITKQAELINEIYSYYELEIQYYYEARLLEPAIIFTVLKTPESSCFIDNNALFVDVNYTSDNIELFSLLLYYNKLYYKRSSGKVENHFDFEKNKRTPITITTNLIDDIKKKEK